jgi:hypothetical protein
MQSCLAREAKMGEGFVSLLPLMILSIPYAVFAGAVARRLNGNAVVWVILALIPMVGWFFWWYILYKIVTGILDRIDVANTKSAFS